MGTLMGFYWPFMGVIASNSMARELQLFLAIPRKPASRLI